MVGLDIEVEFEIDAEIVAAVVADVVVGFVAEGSDVVQQGKQKTRMRDRCTTKLVSSLRNASAEPCLCSDESPIELSGRSRSLHLAVSSLPLESPSLLGFLWLSRLLSGPR